MSNTTTHPDQLRDPASPARMWVSLENGDQLTRAEFERRCAAAPHIKKAEIASSSAAIDLHRKLRVYLRGGVQEYLVWRTLDQQLDWFELREGDYIRLAPNDHGRLRSRVFPGLWLAVTPLLAGDLATVLSELHTGLASDEHAALLRPTEPPSTK